MTGLVCPVLHKLRGDGVCLDGALIEGASRPDSLLMVLHALWLECEKSIKFTASTHHSCFSCLSRDSRDEAAISESVPTGAQVKERWRTLHSLSQHGT